MESTELMDAAKIISPDMINEWAGRDKEARMELEQLVMAHELRCKYLYPADERLAADFACMKILGKLAHMYGIPWVFGFYDLAARMLAKHGLIPGIEEPWQAEGTEAEKASDATKIFPPEMLNTLSKECRVTRKELERLIMSYVLRYRHRYPSNERETADFVCLESFRNLANLLSYSEAFSIYDLIITVYARRGLIPGADCPEVVI